MIAEMCLYNSKRKGKSILGMLEELQIYDYELSGVRCDDGMAKRFY